MSSDAESISSGMALPGWMRAKIEKSDFDGIPFSPPSHDESFFYIRYPVKPDSDTKTGIRQITDIFHDGRSQNKFRQNVDFSNHTEPCKRFLKDSPNTPGDTIKNPPKSFGTDDGFKGPGAACGNSIVKVAQQMVSNRTLTTRGFKVAHLEQTSPVLDSDNAFQTKTIEDQQIQSSKLIQPQSQLPSDDIVGNQQQQQQQQDSVSKFLNQQQQEQQYQQQLQQMTQSSRLMYRRGSKSLPSSPLGSPKSMRKYNPNPYFTTTSLFSSNNSSSAEGRGWFLSSLLGIQREATSTSSIPHIEEESDVISTTQNKYNNNNSNQKSESQKLLRAKPSELREMNFWSPTSM